MTIKRFAVSFVLLILLICISVSYGQYPETKVLAWEKMLQQIAQKQDFLVNNNNNKINSQPYDTPVVQSALKKFAPTIVEGDAIPLRKREEVIAEFRQEHNVKLDIEVNKKVFNDDLISVIDDVDIDGNNNLNNIDTDTNTTFPNFKPQQMTHKFVDIKVHNTTGIKIPDTINHTTPEAKALFSSLKSLIQATSSQELFDTLDTQTKITKQSKFQTQQTFESYQLWPTWLLDADGTGTMPGHYISTPNNQPPNLQNNYIEIGIKAGEISTQQLFFVGIDSNGAPYQTTPPPNVFPQIVLFAFYDNGGPYYMETIDCTPDGAQFNAQGQIPASFDACDNLDGSNYAILDFQQTTCTQGQNGVFTLKMAIAKANQHNSKLAYFVQYHAGFDAYGWWAGVRASIVNSALSRQATQLAGHPEVLTVPFVNGWNPSSGQLTAQLGQPIIISMVLVDKYANIIYPGIDQQGNEYPRDYLQLLMEQSLQNPTIDGIYPSDMIIDLDGYPLSLQWSRVINPIDNDAALKDYGLCFNVVYQAVLSTVLADPDTLMGAAIMEPNYQAVDGGFSMAFPLWNNVVTYNAQPTPFYSTTPSLIFVSDAKYITTQDGRSIKHTTRQYKFQLLDQYGNYIQFIGVTEPWLPNLSVSSITTTFFKGDENNDASCPIPTCGTSQGVPCCVGFECSLTFEITHDAVQDSTCIYNIGTTKIYPLLLTPFHEWTGITPVTDTQSAQISFMIEQNQSFALYCRLGNYKDAPLFPCRVSSQTTHFCNTGPNDKCAVSIIEQICVETTTFEAVDMTLCTSSSFDFGPGDEIIWNEISTTCSSSSSTTTKYNLQCQYLPEEVTPDVEMSIFAPVLPDSFNTGSSYAFILQLRNNQNQTLVGPSELPIILYLDWADVITSCSNVHIANCFAYGVTMTNGIDYEMIVSVGQPIGAVLRATCLIGTTPCPNIDGKLIKIVAGRMNTQAFVISDDSTNMWSDVSDTKPYLSPSSAFYSYVPQWSLPMSAWHKVNKNYTTYIYPRDAYGNRAEPFGDEEVFIAVILGPVITTGKGAGEAILCENDDKNKGSSSTSIKTQFYTFNPMLTGKVEPKANSGWFEPYSRCFYDTQKKLYVLQWATLTATQLINNNNGNLFAIPTRFTAFLSTTYNYNNPSYFYETFFAVAPSSNIPADKVGVSEMYVTDGPDGQQQVTKRDSDILPAGSSFIALIILVDEFLNAIYPIMIDNSQTWPEVTSFVDWDHDLYTNYGADVILSFLHYNIQDGGRVAWFQAWRNYGALEYTSGLQYNDVILAQRTITTTALLPAAIAGTKGIGNLTMATNNNGENWYQFTELRTLSLHDRYGNVPILTDMFIEQATSNAIQIVMLDIETDQEETADLSICPPPKCFGPNDQCCYHNATCEVSFTMTNAVKDKLCVYYYWGLATSQQNQFMKVNMTQYQYYWFKLPDLDSISQYQYRCIIAENTDDIANLDINPYYIENLKPQIPNDANRLVINERWVECNIDAIRSTFCTTTQTTTCPIRVMRRSCYDLRLQVPVDESNCRDLYGDYQHILNPTLNNIWANDDLSVDLSNTCSTSNPQSTVMADLRCGQEFDQVENTSDEFLPDDASLNVGSTIPKLSFNILLITILSVGIKLLF